MTYSYSVSVDSVERTNIVSTSRLIVNNESLNQPDREISCCHLGIKIPYKRTSVLLQCTAVTPYLGPGSLPGSSLRSLPPKLCRTCVDKCTCKLERGRECRALAQTNKDIPQTTPLAASKYSAKDNLGLASEAASSHGRPGGNISWKPFVHSTRTRVDGRARRGAREVLPAAEAVPRGGAPLASRIPHGAARSMVGADHVPGEQAVASAGAGGRSCCIMIALRARSIAPPPRPAILSSLCDTWQTAACQADGSSRGITVQHYLLSVMFAPHEGLTRGTSRPKLVGFPSQDHRRPRPHLEAPLKPSPVPMLLPRPAAVPVLPSG